MAERVHFVPSVAPEELLAHTRQADAGATVLEDNCENHRLALPNKVFEYVAAGVPVVSNDLPELRALLEHHGIGWTVPIDRPEELARALGRAVANRDDPAQRARLERAAAELSWTREQVRLIEVYSSLRQRGRPA
jgi:glycosyltransferase involved in cell wall biosynthesis